MTYKALLCDVDGTLVPNLLGGGMLSPGVISAIKKASKKIHVGVATSRPYFMMEGIFKTLRLKGPSVINAGARVIDVTTKKVLWEKRLEEHAISHIHDVAKSLGINLIINNGDEDTSFTKGHVVKDPLVLYAMDLDAVLADTFIDMLNPSPTIVAHKVPAWEKGKITVSITHTAATKQHGIYEVAKLLGIKTHEIIAVGDGQNDFPMLMAAGLKITLQNGVKELKEIADYIAPSVEDDGMVDIIEKFVLKK
jgi:HAD superfamily hydrolase (TIGR01484 family)